MDRKKYISMMDCISLRFMMETRWLQVKFCLIVDVIDGLFGTIQQRAVLSSDGANSVKALTHLALNIIVTAIMMHKVTLLEPAPSIAKSIHLYR